MFKTIRLLFSVLGLGADIITVTTGTAGNAGNTVAELITFMSAQMLDVAELNMVLKQFGEVHQLPENSSKTIRFTREEKFTVSATPTQLTEGIPPDAQGLTINQVEAVTKKMLGQYFDYMRETPKAFCTDV